MHPKEPLFRVINPSPPLKVSVNKVEVQRVVARNLCPLRFYAETQKSFITGKRGLPRACKSLRTFVIQTARVIQNETKGAGKKAKRRTPRDRGVSRKIARTGRTLECKKPFSRLVILNITLQGRLQVPIVFFIVGYVRKPRWSTIIVPARNTKWKWFAAAMCSFLFVTPLPERPGFSERESRDGKKISRL